MQVRQAQNSISILNAVNEQLKKVVPPPVKRAKFEESEFVYTHLLQDCVSTTPLEEKLCPEDTTRVDIFRFFARCSEGNCILKNHIAPRLSVFERWTALGLDKLCGICGHPADERDKYTGCFMCGRPVHTYCHARHAVMMNSTRLLKVTSDLAFCFACAISQIEKDRKWFTDNE